MDGIMCESLVVGNKRLSVMNNFELFVGSPQKSMSKNKQPLKRKHPFPRFSTAARAMPSYDTPENHRLLLADRVETNTSLVLHTGARGSRTLFGHRA